jgi:hypothetical protein
MSILVTMIFIALASLPVSGLFALYCYVQHRRTHPPDERIPFIGFALKVLLVGLAAYFIGCAFGVGSLCWSRSAGNMCGLPGAVIFGPLCASVGVAIAAGRLSVGSK